MIVAGGCYQEFCDVPHWHRLFGSGLRAAAAISSLSPGSQLFGYACKDWLQDVERSVSAFGIKPVLTEIDEDISFSYFHPMSNALLDPVSPTMQSPLNVSGEAVVRFGLVEGGAVVDAKYATYDPQTGSKASAFHENGSRTEHLAVVLNSFEANQITGLNVVESGTVILKLHKAEVVIIKDGPRGAMVFTPGSAPAAVPAYWSDTVFKIGSGDVFTAAFAYYWSEQNLPPIAAADAASRSVAHYVNTRSLPLPHVDELEQARPITTGNSAKQIYLAGPFFDIAQRWLIEEARNRLIQLEVPVFSPFHDVGTGRSASELAQADLRGLDNSCAVLALLDGTDPGTIFEVGYARAKRIPVVALAARLDDHHLTMFTGSDCNVVNDFVSAIYHTAWIAWAPQ